MMKPPGEPGTLVGELAFHSINTQWSIVTNQGGSPDYMHFRGEFLNVLSPCLILHNVLDQRMFLGTDFGEPPQLESVGLESGKASWGSSRAASVAS